MIPASSYIYARWRTHTETRDRWLLLPSYDSGQIVAPIGYADWCALLEAMLERVAASDAAETALLPDLSTVSGGTRNTFGISGFKTLHDTVLARFCRTDTATAGSGLWSAYDSAIQNTIPATGATHRCCDAVRWLYHDIRRCSLFRAECATVQMSNDEQGTLQTGATRYVTENSSGTQTTTLGSDKGLSLGRYFVNYIDASTKTRAWDECDNYRVSVPSNVNPTVRRSHYLSQGTPNYAIVQLNGYHPTASGEDVHDWVLVPIGTFDNIRSDSGYVENTTLSAYKGDGLQSWLSTATNGASGAYRASAAAGQNTWEATATILGYLITVNFPALAPSDFTGWSWSPPAA